MAQREAEDFREAVLWLVERIPAGRVMTYGAIAECLGKGGARGVGAVMARYGGAVPWHRVVNASGRVAPGHEAEALGRLRAERTPLRGERVDVPAAIWWPPDDPPQALASTPTPPLRGSPAAESRPTALTAPK